ncbi:MAG: putative phosphoribosyl transferase [Eubacteriales bacterium]|nr:putative phosphoribosyl transferase [Eubacteriales bacterium]MDN5363591.1 putative phosphoribosyl transferase [Eubacteriales bacterium]
MIFRDRIDAGRQLAEALREYKGRENVVVLAVPRGGVIVGDQIASYLGCPLDLVVPRKIGAPFNPEMAIGAVTQDGTLLLNEYLVYHLGIDREEIEAEKERVQREIKRRLALYRGNSVPPELAERTVILTDDGIATGFTLEAAIASIRRQRPAELVLAVPVAPPDTLARLEKKVDRVVCLHTPEEFYAVGQFYENFSQTTDEEVIEVMQKYKYPSPAGKK